MTCLEAIMNIDWTKFVNPESKFLQGKSSAELEHILTSDFRETIKRAIIADMTIAAIKELKNAHV